MATFGAIKSDIYFRVALIVIPCGQNLQMCDGHVVEPYVRLNQGSKSAKNVKFFLMRTNMAASADSPRGAPRC